jgi:hypothetical protein
MSCSVGIAQLSRPIRFLSQSAGQSGVKTASIPAQRQLGSPSHTAHMAYRPNTYDTHFFPSVVSSKIGCTRYHFLSCSVMYHILADSLAIQLQPLKPQHSNKGLVSCDIPTAPGDKTYDFVFCRIVKVESNAHSKLCFEYELPSVIDPFVSIGSLNITMHIRQGRKLSIASILRGSKSCC